MGKHFLATISNDSDHLFGVRFICSFFNKMSENRVTLLHIRTLDSSKKALGSIWDNPNDAPPDQIPVEAKKSINKAQKLLRDHNVPVDHVLTKTVAERYGKVKDIIIESASGHYDAIVLGRRASYTLQWMFERSADETFQALIREHSCVSPLWICAGVDPDRKNVLLCIDGSENACRAVDHVGYILSSQDQHTITLLHVENSVGTECVEYFRRAEAILHGHNINPQQVKQKVVWGLSVSRTILSEAKKGNYSVVAVGMGGKKQGKEKGRMASTTTAKLISKLEKTSLWCCP